MPALGSLLMAVETKTRSPQTMGLDTATPGIGVFHRMFSPVVVFHLTGVGWPSATPAAFAPRKEGQFCARVVVEKHQASARASDRSRCDVFTRLSCRWKPESLKA